MQPRLDEDEEELEPSFDETEQYDADAADSNGKYEPVAVPEAQNA